MSSPDIQTADDAIGAISSALGERLLNVRRPVENRVYIEVDADTIPETAKVLSHDLPGRLQTASAVNAPNKIEILYHWALDSIGLVITIRTRIDREQAAIASITDICPSAHWIEREMWELMGISFSGHPDLRHLLLQDDWPEGKFPLRRDFKRD